MKLLSENFQRTANAQSSGDVMLMLLTGSHPSLDPSAWLHLVFNTVAVVSNGVTYNSVHFDVGRPIDSAVDEPVSQFLIDNIDQTIGDFIDACPSPPTFQLDQVLESNLDFVEDSITFLLNDARYNASQASGTLDAERLGREPFPGDTVTPLNNPGSF